MSTNITQIATDFINGILEFFAEGNGELRLDEIERGLTPLVSACACDLASQHIEDIDKRIRENKTGRRKAGYTIERRDDERRVLTTFGEVCYLRTYYACKGGTYTYLTDRALGIENYARLSDGVSVSLAKAAGKMSYAGSGAYVTGGSVSRQTVMNKVRSCETVPMNAPEHKRKIPELHIDADEAHITLRGGRKSEVPLISIYEGIELVGKRHFCKNIFHISEYGKSPDDLWEQALTEVEKRYDLTDARIYLHGDGANWIRKGFEWFPGAVFVLDKYHKNKAIKNMTAGLSAAGRVMFDTAIRDALDTEDISITDRLTNRLCAALPARAGKILQSAEYLKTHIAGIGICKTDPSANNGGCTEPHVSHILSARLSSRPMAWSTETLSRLAPMLANEGNIRPAKPAPVLSDSFLRKARRQAALSRRNLRSAADPNSIGNIIPIRSGKVTQLQRSLKAFSSVYSL